MNRVITEITPLQEEDCFYLIDRYKESFTYPIHKHEEVELNFGSVIGCAGCACPAGECHHLPQNAHEFHSCRRGSGGYDGVSILSAYYRPHEKD